jgi:hypothetical protein
MNFMEHGIEVVQQALGIDHPAGASDANNDPQDDLCLGEAAVRASLAGTAPSFWCEVLGGLSVTIDPFCRRTIAKTVIPGK